MDYSMEMAPVAVTQCVTLELIDATGASTPLEAELQYDPSDPYAVTTVFMTGRSQVRWTSDVTSSPRGCTSPPGRRRTRLACVSTSTATRS